MTKKEAVVIVLRAARRADESAKTMDEPAGDRVGYGETSRRLIALATAIDEGRVSFDGLPNNPTATWSSVIRWAAERGVDGFGWARGE